MNHQPLTFQTFQLRPIHLKTFGNRSFHRRDNPRTDIFPIFSVTLTSNLKEKIAQKTQSFTKLVLTTSLENPAGNLSIGGDVVLGKSVAPDLSLVNPLSSRFGVTWNIARNPLMTIPHFYCFNWPTVVGSRESSLGLALQSTSGGHCKATARPLLGHCQATARPLLGHCQATARPLIIRLLHYLSDFIFSLGPFQENLFSPQAALLIKCTAVSSMLNNLYDRLERKQMDNSWDLNPGPFSHEQFVMAVTFSQRP